MVQLNSCSILQWWNFRLVGQGRESLCKCQSLQHWRINRTTPFNTTIEEDSSLISYTGTWVENSSPRFSSNQKSRYTRENNASFTVNFNGNAIYVIGDVVNDHGLYSVYLDSFPREEFSGIAGCRGKGACEADGTLAYFRSGLSDGSHKLTIVNNATKEQPYAGDSSTFGWRAFDLDVIYVTTAGSYGSAPLATTITSTSTAIGSISASFSNQANSPAASNSNSGATATFPTSGLSIVLLYFLVRMLSDLLYGNCWHSDVIIFFGGLILWLKHSWVF